MAHDDLLWWDMRHQARSQARQNAMLRDRIDDLIEYVFIVIELFVNLLAAWVCYKMNSGKSQGFRVIMTVLAFFLPSVVFMAVMLMH